MVLDECYINPSTSKNTNTANQTDSLDISLPCFIFRSDYYYQSGVHYSSPFSVSLFASLTKISHAGMYSRHSITTGWMNVCVRTHTEKKLLCVCLWMCFDINHIALYILFGNFVFFLFVCCFLFNSISWDYFHGTTNCFISFNSTAA